MPSSQPPRHRRLLVAGAVVAGVLGCARTAQTAVRSGPWHESRCEFRRTIELEPSTPVPEVVVVAFHAHGQLRADGSPLAVYEGRQLRPWRVLQQGPGDFCRLAFQTRGPERRYDVYYGGDGQLPASPPWTSTAGLELETRAWSACDLHQLADVQRAFEAAAVIGADYVPQVFHRENPFGLRPGPFLSRYRGSLQVPVAGKVAFYTSSQDCSFLLIDGQLVVAAPGRHAPVPQARIQGEVQLAAGPHSFEYFHAAAGDEACMVAAWKLPGFDKPSPIGAEVFRDAAVVHRGGGTLERRPRDAWPDLRFDVTGELPLADRDAPLVRVEFDSPLGADVPRTRYEWDFGDGQTSSEPRPVHVYLHPGEYPVQIVTRRGGESATLTNRIVIGPPTVAETKGEDPTLAQYLEILQAYEPARLDGEGLVQLVHAYRQAGDFARAAAAGTSAFTADAQDYGDEIRWQIALLVGPILRDQLDDARGAVQFWRDVRKRLRRREWQARAALEAADIALRYALVGPETSAWLEYAARNLESADAESARLLARIQGDWHARHAQGSEARAAYARAAAAQPARTVVADTAARGARSHSVEAFLREGQLDRARDELRQWELAFPEDKAAGYLPLLWARYHRARAQPALAITTAQDALAVNADSPYADQLLLLLAECEEQSGNVERAAAAYQSLTVDYPGSPLVDRARESLGRLRPATRK